MRFQVSARVTGFDYSTFHAYTTEVAVDGRSWALAVRYNTFFKFYSQLLEVEPRFKAPFPPKGGIFFSPLPEERQVQLDDFVQNTLTFYDLRGRPDAMGALIDDLLEISDHLKLEPVQEEEALDNAQEPDAEEEKLAVEQPKAQEPEVEDLQGEADGSKEIDEPKETEEPKEILLPAVKPREKAVKHKEEPAKPKEKEESGFMSSLWGKAVSAAIQAVVVNTFQENAEAGKTAESKVIEPATPAKSLDAVDFETPTSPASRGSFSKTPRQSATVTPLVIPAVSSSPLKTEIARQEPITVATVGVRDRIASLERAMSKSSSPSSSMPSSPIRTPRGAGRRSSSCSSAGDHAPVVPLGAAEMPKLVKTEEEETVETGKTEKEAPVVKEEIVVANESNDIEAEEMQKKEEKEEEADESEPAQVSTEDSAAAESSVEKVAEVESIAKTPESAKAVVDEKEVEEDVEAGKNIAVEEPQPMEEAAEGSQDAYDSDASDEIRQLKLEKIDVNERLRFYRQPVFFQGFYCRVHRMSVVEDDLRL